MYVVFGHFRYQDCSENSSEMIQTIEDGLAWMKKYGQDKSCMASFRMFKLGDEVKVMTEDVEEVESIKKTVRQFKII